MKLAKVWMVRDATPVSTLEDICWEQDVARLGRYVWGSGQGVWEAERTTFYTDKGEALADAKARLALARKG
ncbi:MAG: hypothetical protein ACLQVI_05150 [Polyangiaceae bacterium]|jgi:hypothetical protein